MPDAPFVCFDRDLPLALGTAPTTPPPRSAGDNRRRDGEAAGLRRRYWAPGTTLSVRFLDSREPADTVLDIARQWSEHADIRLQQVDDVAADLRVTFASTGNWSVLSTESRLAPADEPTMCLSEVAGTPTPSRLRRVVLHEFGHAIGVIHEHQNPAAYIQWNDKAVYAELAGPPNYWDQATAHANVLSRYAVELTNHTSFNPLSVMLYQLPASWTHDRRTYPDNTEISALDAEIVRERYPRATPH